MPSFVVDGEEYELVEDMTLGEAEECERYLGLSLENAKGAGMLLLSMFIARRKQHPEEDPEAVALRVRSIPISKMDIKEDEPDPPAEGGK